MRIEYHSRTMSQHPSSLSSITFCNLIKVFIKLRDGEIILALFEIYFTAEHARSKKISPLLAILARRASFAKGSSK